MNTIERKARSMALAWINNNRQAAGKPKLRRLEAQWWRLYREEWMNQVKPK